MINPSSMFGLIRLSNLFINTVSVSRVFQIPHLCSVTSSLSHIVVKTKAIDVLLQKERIRVVVLKRSGFKHKKPRNEAKQEFNGVFLCIATSERSLFNYRKNRIFGIELSFKTQIQKLFNKVKPVTLNMALIYYHFLVYIYIYSPNV